MAATCVAKQYQGERTVAFLQITFTIRFWFGCKNKVARFVRALKGAETRTRFSVTLQVHFAVTSQSTHSVSITNTYRLMTCREVNAANFENHIECVNTLCVQSEGPPFSFSDRQMQGNVANVLVGT